ncbi:MAG: hypothetical protein ACE5FG_01350 [Myxococcota bacterium]
MRFLLGMLVILFDLMDNFTTFICLTSEPIGVPGAVLTEANPVARWLFESVGLYQGLVFSTVVTVSAVAFLVFTKRLHPTLRLLLLGVLAILPAFAAVNNYLVMQQVGIVL